MRTFLEVRAHHYLDIIIKSCAEYMAPRPGLFLWHPTTDWMPMSFLIVWSHTATSQSRLDSIRVKSECYSENWIYNLYVQLNFGFCSSYFFFQLNPNLFCIPNSSFPLAFFFYDQTINKDFLECCLSVSRLLAVVCTFVAGRNHHRRFLWLSVISRSRKNAWLLIPVGWFYDANAPDSEDSLPSSRNTSLTCI